MKNFTPIIGLEIHVELKTRSKMFCSCAADYFGKKPNTHTCPVCLGLPGALPVPNKTAIEWCIKLGLALNCQIPAYSKFDRKNYFYPDLPKGYQISQYDQPFAVNGHLAIEGKKIRIRRVHMEEDTGKLLHAKVDEENCTLIDFNRSGVPLVEIVTEPDIRSSTDAKKFLQELYLIIRYLDISDADMEKGSMRLEPNISVRIKNDELPKYKVEVKNINSFNFVKKAIDYEVERQIEILEKGETPKQETRGWDENKGLTYSQRTKEEAHDYRYFPEPDIPPFRWDSKDIKAIKIPELPQSRRLRLVSKLELRKEEADILVSDKQKADYFEEAVNVVRRLKIGEITVQELANWIVNKRIDVQKSTPADLVKAILGKRKKSEISSDTLTKALEEVLKNNQKAVADFKQGKQQALMFLLGQVLRITKGKGRAEDIKKLLIEKLT